MSTLQVGKEAGSFTAGVFSLFWLSGELRIPQIGTAIAPDLLRAWLVA